MSLIALLLFLAAQLLERGFLLMLTWNTVFLVVDNRIEKGFPLYY